MKSIKLTLALLVAAGTLLVSCKKETTQGKKETRTETKAIASTETTSFSIDGMTCPEGCAKVIENKIAGMEGVQKATIDFDKKTATIQYDATTQSPEKIVETVESIADGKTYKVSNVSNSADQASNFTDKEKGKKKKKKAKIAETATTEAATPAANCTPTTEKKGGCCAAKKACSADVKPAGVL